MVITRCKLRLVSEPCSLDEMEPLWFVRLAAGEPDTRSLIREVMMQVINRGTIRIRITCT